MDGTLSELLLQQVRHEPGRAAGLYLQGFRTAAELAPPADDAVRRLLQRHELMRPTEAGLWRLRVPLMQRWVTART